MRLIRISDCDPISFTSVFNDALWEEYKIGPSPFTQDDSRAFWEKKVKAETDRTEFAFGVEVQGKIVGVVSLHQINWKARFAQVFYWFDISERRKGYARESLLQLIREAFEIHNLNRIEAQLRSDNVPSKCLLEAVGFTQEAFQKEKWINNEIVYDGLQYRLLRSEYSDAFREILHPIMKDNELTKVVDTQSTSSASEQNALNIILHEHTTIREEVNKRLGFYFHLFEIYVLLIAGVFGFLLQTGNYDYLLLLPVLSLALFYRLMWDQQMAWLLGDYVIQVIEPRLEKFVGKAPEIDCNGEPCVRSWFGWLDYFPPRIRKMPKGYKHSAAIIFLGLPLGASLAYSVWHLFTVFTSVPSVTKLPQSIHLSFFGIYAMAAAVILVSHLIRLYRNKF